MVDADTGESLADVTVVVTSPPIGRNPNFGNTASRYAPAFGRLGARLTF